MARTVQEGNYAEFINKEKSICVLSGMVIYIYSEEGSFSCPQSKSFAVVSCKARTKTSTRRSQAHRFEFRRLLNMLNYGVLMEKGRKEKKKKRNT